jgi:hypothetical protein
LIIYSIFQVLPAQADNSVLKKIAPAYWISSLANMAWIFLWHYQVFSLTLAAMITLLISLIFIYLQLKTTAGSQKWLVKLPFSIYLGWITVATVANAAQFLYFFNWGGWGIAGSIWAVIMLAVAGVLGLLMAWREMDPPYVLVLVWAFIGITVSQLDTQLVVNAAWTAVAVLATGLVVSMIKNRKVY